MSLYPFSDAESQKHRILVIDRKKLRQAGIIRLLEAWADYLGLMIVAVPVGEGCIIDASCEMVILSVGGDSVEDAQHKWIKTLCERVPHAPLVILSDREEPDEVCAAFRAGASGFMPTSIELPAALHALSFIKSGGAFFPPSILSHTNEGHGWSHEIAEGELTARQEEVIRLVRQGESNKLIARRLGMSEATVKVHVRRIMRKLGVKNRTQVAISAVNDSVLGRPHANGNATSEA